MNLDFNTKELRIIAATGVLGSGFVETSFNRGLKRKPHLIGADAGSTDPGPYFLASGNQSFPEIAVKRDLRLMVLAARKLDIPLIIGSCGTAGGKPHLNLVKNILEQIKKEENLKFKTAIINAEQDKEYIINKYNNGKIKPLNPCPKFNLKTIENSIRIVGMMGAEPFIKALSEGADVILAGRSSDTAIFASLPVMLGFSEGLSWHAAKILECGAAAATQRKVPDCLMATIKKDCFLIEPLDPELKCTPQSVAAHSLYENADPYIILESKGAINLKNVKYEALDDRTVKVSGSEFIIADNYTVKLEGAELAGFQSIIIGSVRDPLIIKQIDEWLDRLKSKVSDRVKDLYKKNFDDFEYSLIIHIYGKNGTMGKLEQSNLSVSHELCLLFEITASTQDIATSIASITRHQALHLPIPEWSGLITAIACPFNPSYIDRGPQYRFNVNHVVEVDDPLEMFELEYI